MSIPISILFITIALSILGAANYYVGYRLYRWIATLLPNISTKVFIPIYIALTLIMIISLTRFVLPSPGIIKSVLSWVGVIWMGLFLYFLFYFAITDIFLFLGSLLKLLPRPYPISARLYSGLIVVLATLITVGYGFYNYSRVKTTTYDLTLENKSLTQPIEVLFVSDLHLGSVGSEQNLQRVVDSINAKSPDIVCLVGDIFNDNYDSIDNPEEAKEFFRSIRSTYGVFATLGNHDGGKTHKDFLSFFADTGVTLLNDEYIVIDNRLALFGRVDPTPIGGFEGTTRKEPAEFAALFSEIDPDMPIIIMDHNPINFKEYDSPVDLVISGHTHAGQLFPINLITNAMYLTHYGYYHADSASPHLIVSSGAGTWGMPLRTSAHNEVVRITLQPIE